MPITKYKIKQTVTIDSDIIVNNFSIDCDSTVISNFLALLEGEYEVYVEDDNLSGGSSTATTSYNAVSKINLSGKTSTGAFLFTSIKPFKGVMYMKNTADSDAIKTVFATSTPFPLAPTEKPTKVSSTIVEQVTAVSP